MSQQNQNHTVSAEHDNSSVYIARQPIFDTAGRACAYELLYRDTERNTYNPTIDSDIATGAVISEAILNFGLKELTTGKKAFVNFSNGYLLDRAADLLNPKHFVIEILENVSFTPAVIVALYNLKDAGFELALDDYIGRPIPHEILNLISIIKIDFMLTTPEQRAVFVIPLIKKGKKLLAEKIETKENMEEAISLGCEMFQGYFYSKPMMIKKNNLDIASSSYIKLMAEILNPSLDIERIAGIINWDVHLTYKLLKRMKTIQYYRGNTITSIKEALVLMGDEEIRRWIMLVLIRVLMGSRSDELIRTALIRAFLCEKLARETNNHKYSVEAFTTGMFSIIDLGTPETQNTITELPLPDIVKDSLNGIDNILYQLLNISLYYENGDWNLLEKFVKETELSINLQVLRAHYFISISAADEMLAKDM